jgi:hypothetical protein
VGILLDGGVIMAIERIEKDGKRTMIQGPTVAQDKLQALPPDVRQRIAGPQRTARSADFWADPEEAGAVYIGGTRIIKLRQGLEPRAEVLAAELNAALRRVVDAPMTRNARSRAQAPSPRPPARPAPPPPIPTPKPKGGPRGPRKA